MHFLRSGSVVLLACALGLSGSGGCAEKIECSSVDRVVYLHGTSAGPCTDRELTVDADGAVTKRWNLLNQVGITAGAECTDEQSESSTISAGEARTLLDTVCQSYNETYEEPPDCEGAWRYVTLFQGATELAATGNLGCGESMVEAIDALELLED